MKVQPYPYAFFDGQQTKIEDAKVSVMTNALQYGTGIFGGIRAYYSEGDEATYLFRLDEHFARFINSAKILGCPLPYTHDQFKDILTDLVKKNQPTGDAYLRIFGYVGNTELGPNLAGTTLDFTIYMIALNEYMPLGKGLNLVVSSWRRVAETAIPTRAKISGAYVNSALARKEATDGGFDEAIMLRENGLVSEGSAENIFMVRDGVLITPTASEGILEGMTRRSVMELAVELGIKAEARPIEKSELYVADEVFLSGTACQVAWVASIDKRTIGTGEIGPITKRLQDKFFGIVRGTDPDHAQWRTKVSLAKVAS
jgi:branched-chain amino acid aminotransferase